ncbi:benzoate/H(+) symporter BenE family transporter [cf. Phormidesmis sp. LEGE 11477]|uniref:benzoate/H(+) symporter BenE family transporter n=1 Tax=cf. Phormidesmis sp. LEGE 11477 TaxID=1828680 RepID=UPI00187EBE7E|nr:benzoate/H(+) symporter BenE family transporter [cf. Phormidesmis sp. LEGE 11477]MBE9061678.1 benzoate/H(+) symporter BenE family transporter [cf. Phormidesmis sp. LEGE 11477]
MTFAKDFSLSALIAGFVSVLVGFTSAGVIVFQAAQSLGASPEEIGSWIWALGLGMGLTSILLSWRYKMPVVTAWSTPGAALLIPAASGVSMAEGIGAFLVCAALITLCGFTGWFERAINLIPLPLASAMLAGVLLRFGLNVFVAMQTQFVMTFTMFCVYLLVRQAVPRYTILAALIVGGLIAGGQGLLQLEVVKWQLAQPVFTTPQFSVTAIIGIALPLFVVTMASQNVPGVATIRAFGYNTPISPLIGWTGVATLILAPFGAFAINLAAITAAITMGKEAHEDADKRYIAAMAAGVFYIIVGIFGATVVGLFSALPEELVLTIAGLALLSTIGKSLAIALSEENEREAALVTFLVTASGMALLNIGSAFWGIVAGALVVGSRRLMSRRRTPRP